MQTLQERLQVLDSPHELVSLRAVVSGAPLQIQAEADAKKTIARARQQAQHTHEDAVRQLKRDAADIAVEISARVLEREVSEQDNAHIIDTYFSELERQPAAERPGGWQQSGADGTEE